MENDRIQCRMDGDALAPPWWESFGFIRDKKFINDSKKYDKFTYGAIFKLIGSSPLRNPSAPEYVVAFRGTMLLHPKAMKDLVQDFYVLFNKVADFKRFQRAYSDVDSLLRDLGSRNLSVWIAGHSLGASLALEIGRKLMLNENLNVPTFLFNPPHVSPGPVIDEVLTEKNKTRLYTVSYAVKFGLANAMPWHRKRTKELFRHLADWKPELYVNPDDWICRGYIDYFVQREQVSKNHPRFASTAARTSYRDMFLSMFFYDKLQSHLLPSARLWTSSTRKQEAHGLRQWWKPHTDLGLTTTSYGYSFKAPS
uniref:Uncharacterized protein n=1 Tax=Avena sativa TaxID=4498 RepID=A0ACD6AJJ1_AVESA